MGDAPVSPSVGGPRQRYGAPNGTETEPRRTHTRSNSKAEKVRHASHVDALLYRIYLFTGLTTIALLYISGGFNDSRPGNEGHLLAVEDLPAVFVADSEPWNPMSGNGLAEVEAEQAGSVKKGIVTARTTTEVFPGQRNFPLNKEPALRLIVLTMNRHVALQRLLDSLAEADYEGDHVDLDIWIDRKRGEGTHDLTLTVAKDFSWKFGTKRIHKRLENAGLYEQWIYTWDVRKDSKEVPLILEDDLEVSPVFWKWLKCARKAYENIPDVGSYTLQRGTLRARQIRRVATGPLRIPSNNNAYLYRLLGTWGFSPNRATWIEFRKWFEEKRAANEKPYVRGLITTKWYKSQEVNGVASTMWSQWWIKFADERGVFTVYAQLPARTTLAANWRESGMHYFRKRASRDFSVYRGSSEDICVLPKNPLRLGWDGRPVSA